MNAMTWRALTHLENLQIYGNWLHCSVPEHPVSVVVFYLFLRAAIFARDTMTVLNELAQARNNLRPPFVAAL